MADSLLTDAPAPAPEPTDQPAPAPGATQAGAPGTMPSWIDGLPDDLKGSPSLRRYKDPSELAKGYTELEKKLGQGFRVPGKDADQKEWDALYKAIGVPESIDKYEITPPDDIPFDEDSKNRLLNQALRMKLTGAQVNELIKAYGEDVKLSMEERKETFAKAEEYLKEQYRGNFDRNLAIAQRALKAHDPDGTLTSLLDETGLGNHPNIVNLFYTVGKSMVEDGMIPGEVAGVHTKELALKKIAEIEADAKHPYHRSKAGDPIHTEVTKLYELAYEE